MVADRVDVISRRAGSDEAWRWSSDGKGSYHGRAGRPGARRRRAAPASILHLMEDATSYTERYTLERIVKAQSGHVPVPISIVEKPGAEPKEIADGAALWTKPKSEITPEDYTDFYRSVAGAVRRAGADRAFPRRGPPRIHGAGLRAGLAAVRPVRSATARAA